MRQPGPGRCEPGADARRPQPSHRNPLLPAQHRPSGAPAAPWEAQHARPGKQEALQRPSRGDGGPARPRPAQHGPAQPRGGIHGTRTYPPALVKWAHVGEPGSGAEPGGHDHGGAIGGKHLEAISMDTINREKQLITQPTGYFPQSHSEGDKQMCTSLPCRYKGSRGFRARSVVSSSQG